MRLLGNDTGWGVEPQTLSNASVHQSNRRKSMKQSQAIRELAGRVPEFWPDGAGRLQYDLGNDGRLVSSCHTS